MLEVIGVDIYNGILTGQKAKTLTTTALKRADRCPVVIVALDMGGGKSNCVVSKNISPTLATTHYGEPVVAYEYERSEDK